MYSCSVDICAGAALLNDECIHISDLRHMVHQINMLIVNVIGIILDYVDCVHMEDNSYRGKKLFQDMGSLLKEYLTEVLYHVAEINSKISGLRGLRLIDGDPRASWIIHKLWRNLFSEHIINYVMRIGALFEEIGDVVKEFESDIPKELYANLGIIAIHGKDHTQALYEFLN